MANDAIDDASVADDESAAAEDQPRRSKRTTSSQLSSPPSSKEHKQWRSFAEGDRVRLRTPVNPLSKRFENIDLSSFGTMGSTSSGGWGSVTLLNTDGDEVTIKVR